MNMSLMISYRGRFSTWVKPLAAMVDRSRSTWFCRFSLWLIGNYGYYIRVDDGPWRRLRMRLGDKQKIIVLNGARIDFK